MACLEMVRLHKCLKLIQASLVEGTEVIEQSLWLTIRTLLRSTKFFSIVFDFQVNYFPTAGEEGPTQGKLVSSDVSIYIHGAMFLFFICLSD